MRFIRFNFAAVLALLLAFIEPSLAGATGYWNVPGNMGQWCGCGFGGGYHAPFMLGPMTHEYLYPPNEVRLPYAPTPRTCAPGYGGCVQGCNCGGADVPTMMAPVETPAATPEPVPAPSARRPMIFAPPVQR